MHFDFAQCKQKGFAPILILVGLLVMIGIAGGAYFLGKSQIQKPQTPSPAITSPTPQASPDETANWKTYISSCYFSIKYPAGWNAQKYFIQDKEDSCVFLTAPDYTQALDKREGFSITITRLAKGTNNMGITINTIDDYIKSLEAIGQPSIPAANKTTKIYGLLNGMQFDFAGFESTTAFVTEQGNYFYVIEWPANEQYSGSYKMYLDQLLSTFKFTDQNQADETINWKTYADPQLGITFKYPSTGIIQTSSSPPQITLNNDRNPPYFLFMIEVVANSQGLTSKQVLENEILALRNNKNIPGDGAKTLADNRQSTIKAYQSGLISGFYMNWGYERDLNGGAIEIVSINNDKIYTFSMHDGNGVTEEFQNKLTDQILSTFKFTN